MRDPRVVGRISAEYTDILNMIAGTFLQMGLAGLFQVKSRVIRPHYDSHGIHFPFTSSLFSSMKTRTKTMPLGFAQKRVLLHLQNIH
jgi:hypothetical protein